MALQKNMVGVFRMVKRKLLVILVLLYSVGRLLGLVFGCIFYWSNLPILVYPLALLLMVWGGYLVGSFFLKGKFRIRNYVAFFFADIVVTVFSILFTSFVSYAEVHIVEYLILGTFANLVLDIPAIYYLVHRKKYIYIKDSQIND